MLRETLMKTIAWLLFLNSIFSNEGYGLAQSSKSADVAPISIMISTDQDAVSSGMKVRIKADVKNSSAEVLNVGTGCDAFQITALDSNGAPVPQSERQRQAIQNRERNPVFRRTAVRLRPGETRKWVCSIGEMFDLTWPGRYSVQFQFGSGAAIVKSNFITFTLTAAPPAKQPAAAANVSFSLHIEADPDTVEAGSKVNVVIYATNITEQPSDIDNSLTKFVLYVEGPRGRDAALTEGGRLREKYLGKAGDNSVHLPPGKEAGIGLLPISDFYNLSQPGEYTIQIARTDAKTKELVKSNVIRVTVAP
jgi:hypothetical protein